MTSFDHELDARGLNCPIPILRTKKFLTTMETGGIVRIMATDPGSVKDFEAFARQTDNELLSSTEAKGEFQFTLKKLS
ncbi:MAG: sulfurtransferase TusA family protein [Pseudomonadota bacterium]|nr:sulfurtransferase TusA family protein [Pseudomonadota bacterium]